MADDKPIIVIKKKGGHGGHHGGAWKVAYADFVTAMMAFFMVMWLVNSADVQTRENIASFFRRPGLFDEGSGTPLMMGGAGILSDAYVPANPSEDLKSKGKGQQMHKHLSGTENLDLDGRVSRRGVEGQGVPTREIQAQGFLPTGKEDEAEGSAGKLETETPDATDPKLSLAPKEAQALEESQRERLEAAAKEIQDQVAANAELARALGALNIKVDADGLLIEILDTEKVSMFQGGSALLSPKARIAFQRIATVLKTLPNKIDIAGYTDAVPLARDIEQYSNWELGADRANAARRALLESKISGDRIESVVSRADRELKVPSNPFSPANRRITLKLRFDLEAEKALLEEERLQESIRRSERNRPENERVRVTPSEVLKKLREEKTAVEVPEQVPVPPAPAPTPSPVFENSPVIDSLL